MATTKLIEDYYSILEVSQFAPISSIKDSYRRLALRYHPDKNKKEDATEAFQRLGRAWEVLQDEAKRAQYDGELLKRKREKEEGEALRARKRREEVDREIAARWARENEERRKRRKKAEQRPPEEVKRIKGWKIAAREEYLSRLRAWILFREEKLRLLHSSQRSLRIWQDTLDAVDEQNVPSGEMHKKLGDLSRRAGINTPDDVAPETSKPAFINGECILEIEKGIRDMQTQCNQIILQLIEDKGIYEREETASRKTRIKEALGFLGPRELNPPLFSVIDRRGQAINHWQTLSRVSGTVKVSTSIESAPEGPWHKSGEWKRISGEHACGRCGHSAFHIIQDCGPAKCPGCGMVVCNECNRELVLLREYGDWLYAEGETAKSSMFELLWDDNGE
ncbi:hypothetical protein G7Y89_g404 [Cudoniella acicularis]|uniref:J domain-containing protein n=1 Tax=Cudoniella acicularis TaxID=354080 RepID=A0A8H4RY72_9HELO|nr:hypothetical protein G7Y89_g404 [Cudoniella acicularis]